MNELFEKRHCIIQKTRNGSAWNYYLFFELALSESEKDETLKNFDSPCMENPSKDFPAHINNIIYKINKNINKIKDKEKKESEILQENNLNISNIYTCKHDTCDMDSPNNSTFRENLNKNNNMENFETAANLNNSSNFVTKPSAPKVKKSHKQFQQTNDDGTVIKKHGKMFNLY